MTAIDPAWLAAARAELDGREKDPDWPAADTAAWRAIVTLLDQGTIELDEAEGQAELQWAEVVAAAAKAEDRRIDALFGAGAATVGKKRATFEQRLIAIANIRRILERAAWRVGECLPGSASTTARGSVREGIAA